METDTSHIEINLEYPVSVEAILNVSFNYEGFKTLFEFILSVLRRHESSLHKQGSQQSLFATDLSELQQTLIKTTNLANSLQVTSESHSNKLDSHESVQSNLSKSLEEVKSTVQNLEDSHKDLQGSVSLLQKGQKLIENQVNDMDNLTQNLEASSNIQKKTLEKHGNELQGLMERLEKIEDELSKLNRTSEFLKKEIENSGERIEKNERVTGEVKDKVERQTGILNEHERRIHQLEMDIEQAMGAIKKLGGEVNQISKPVEPIIQEVSAPVDSSALNDVLDSLSDLKKQIKDLNFRLGNTEETLTKVKDQSDKHESSLKSLEDQIKDLQDYLKRLEDLLKKSSGKPLDLSELKSEVTRDDIDSLKKLLRALEDSLKGKASADDLESLKKQLKALEEAMKRKASLDDVDAMRHSSNTGQPIVTDLKALRELKEKVEDLQRQVQELYSKLGEPRGGGGDSKAIKDLMSRLEDLLKQFNGLSQRIDEQGSRISTFEVNLNKKANKSDLDDLKKLFSSMDFKGGKGEETGEASRLLTLYKRIGAMEDHLKLLVLPEGHDLISIFNLFVKFQTESKDSTSKFEKAIKDLWAKIKELEELIGKKASMDDLKALEELIKQKIKELAEEFMRKFAEKIETKRALKFLEKQIREHETFKSIPEGEDAMLARKPLGGWSCASCQKELEKLIGKVAPYQAWNRMPYRDPADRISRAGPGFSRMLASIQPESLSNRTKNSVFRNSSPPNIEEEIEQVTLPPVKKADRPLTTL